MNYTSVDGVLFSFDMTVLVQFPGGASGVNGFYSVPDSVTSIRWDGFCRCGSLQAVVIPDSVTSIGRAAFYECNQLKYVAYEGLSAPSSGVNVFYRSPVGSVHVFPDYSGSSFCGNSVVRDYTTPTASFSTVITESRNLQDFLQYCGYLYALC